METVMTRKDLLALLEDMAPDRKNEKYDIDDELGNARYKNDAEVEGDVTPLL
jgi:hypothetical protein